MSAIGQPRRNAVDLIRQFGLAPFRRILSPNDFTAIAEQSDCVPERRCPLTPEVVAWLMMYVALLTTSMTQGLKLAWGVVRSICPTLRAAIVTEEAFGEARNRLPWRFWTGLWNLLQRRYLSVFDDALRWKGLLVMGGDGTAVDLPNVPAVAQRFGRPKNGKSRRRQPQGRLVALCSVFTGWCWSFAFMPLRCTEHQALQRLTRTLRSGMLLLLDRGFFAYVSLWMIRQRHAHFLIRLSKQAAGFAKRLHKLGSHDWLVEFRPSGAIYRGHPHLPKTFVYRLIRYHRPGFRVSWLLTSLTNPRRFTRDEIVNLYHRRWTLETLFREWKHALDIHNLRSHTPAGLLKEVYAQLILHQLTRWLMTEAAQGTPHLPLHFSFRTTLSLVKNAVLIMGRTRPHEWSRLYDQLLADIRAASIRQRPGRCYPRPGDTRIKNRGHGKRQRPAKLKAA
jgi:hypothetical protein